MNALMFRYGACYGLTAMTDLTGHFSQSHPSRRALESQVGEAPSTPSSTNSSQGPKDIGTKGSKHREATVPVTCENPNLQAPNRRHTSINLYSSCCDWWGYRRGVWYSHTFINSIFIFQTSQLTWRRHLRKTMFKMSSLRLVFIMLDIVASKSIQI